MSSPIPPLPAIQKRVKALEEKLEFLDNVVRNVDKTLVDIVTQSNKMFQSIQSGVKSTLDTQAEIVGAVLEVLNGTVPNFTELVSKQVESNRLQKAQQEAQQQKDLLADWVAKGFVKTAQTVSDTSVMVLRGLDTSVDPPVAIQPGFMLAEFKNTKPEFKDTIKGQSVGFIFKVQDGISNEIMEIYDFDLEVIKAAELAAEQSSEQESQSKAV